MTNLFLTGGLKTIKALAKLVNIGHAEWSTGDMLMMDGADFSNRGSLQMTDGYASFKGSNIIKVIIYTYIKILLFFFSTSLPTQYRLTSSFFSPRAP